MAESTVNKVIRPFGGGVNPSSYALLRERAKRIFERVRTRCYSEFVSESPANLVGQQDFEHRKTILSAFIERFRMTKTSHSSFAKAIAFTLAETLVVMGIIGVVAALTIPNLNQSTGDREKVAKVKKVYANLTDAYGRATAVYGPIDTWFVNDTDEKAYSKRFADRMTEFMKISKNCEFGDGCFASSPLLDTSGNLDDDNYLSTLKSCNYYMVITADGTSLAFAPPTPTISLGHIRIDIDGPNKGKNQLGNDIFDVVIDNYNYTLTTNLTPTEGDLGFSANNYATAWVIQNGNLDYLKCRDELNWDTKTSCK